MKKEKLGSFISLAIVVTTFILFVIGNVFRLTIVHSGPLLSGSSKEEQFVKGYECFFGGKAFNNNPSLLGIIVGILFVLLITLFVLKTFIRNDLFTKIIKIIIPPFELGMLVVLIYLPMTYVNTLNLNEVTLGASTHLGEYACTLVYYLVCMLITASLAYSIFEVANAKLDLKFGFKTIVLSSTFILFITGYILVFASTIENHVTSSTLPLTPIQEFLGRFALDDKEEVAFRTVMGLSFVTLNISLTLSILFILAKFEDKIKNLLSVVIGLFGVYSGLIIIFAYDMNNSHLQASSIWTIGGIIIIVSSIMHLVFNALIDNK